MGWGLGHATRDIPIIKKLRGEGHTVIIAAEGRPLALLRQEFPDCAFVVMDESFFSANPSWRPRSIPISIPR
jgi:UDP:flavonoid glycosyltransferase YjiC (YdhE family)